MRGAPGKPPALAPPGADAEPPATELRALVRSLPLAIAAAATAGGPLALSFGRSLGVELRPAPGGVELLLRADGRLAAACARAVPEIVAALARRGVGVARAEVRPRHGGGRCVDLPRGLR